MVRGPSRLLLWKSDCSLRLGSGLRHDGHTAGQGKENRGASQHVQLRGKDLTWSSCRRSTSKGNGMGASSAASHPNPRDKSKNVSADAAHEAARSSSGFASSESHHPLPWRWVLLLNGLGDQKTESTEARSHREPGTLAPRSRPLERCEQLILTGPDRTNPPSAAPSRPTASPQPPQASLSLHATQLAPPSPPEHLPPALPTHHCRQAAPTAHCPFPPPTYLPRSAPLTSPGHPSTLGPCHSAPLLL